MLDQRHDYVLQSLADCLDLQFDEVVDAILEGTQVLHNTNLMKEIFPSLYPYRPPLLFCLGFYEQLRFNHSYNDLVIILPSTTLCLS